MLSHMEANLPPKDDTAAVAANVRQAAEAAGVTRNALVAQTGIASTTLFRRWHGQSPYTVTELARIARALGTTISALTSRDDELGAA